MAGWIELERKAAAAMDQIPENPSPSRGPGLLACCIIFTAMSTSFVGARFYRCARVRKFAIEDILIVIALLCGLAVTIIFGLAYGRGSGKHYWQLKPEDMETLFKLNWLSDPVACYAFMTSKLSVGITLLRLGFGKTFQVLICITMGIAVLFNMWPSTAQFVGCNAWKYWANPELKCTPGSEMTLGPLLYIQSGGNIAVDFIYVALLEVYIRRIKLSSRDRFAVRIVLIFMLFATICCIIKTTMFHSLLKSKDSIYDSIPVAQLSVAEIHLALSAACLPAVRLLLGRYFPKQWLFWRTSHESSYTGWSSRHKTADGTVQSRINKTETVQIEDEIVTPEEYGLANINNFQHKEDLKSNRISHKFVAEVETKPNNPSSTNVVDYEPSAKNDKDMV